MVKIAKSPERNTFQKKRYVEEALEEGKSLDDPEVKGTLELYEVLEIEIKQREDELEWGKNDLEYDLRTTDWILEKVRSSEVYAQNLYAAMCNNNFTRNEVIPILKGELWSCSWRHAGGVIADMKQEGDYIDWYCSSHHDVKGYVSESKVTEEIKNDLLKLGWTIVPYND